jgi:hypothetical protein
MKRRIAMKITTTRKELMKIIREEKMSLLKEASESEIERLKGKEVSMRYRKPSGETKTYYGRIINSNKAGRGSFFFGALSRGGDDKGGLKRFTTANVIALHPASLSEKAKLALDEMCKDECIDELCKEVAPKGWAGTVKHMKKHPEVDNPYALANYMKDKGDTSHHFASGKHKASYNKESAEPDDAELINKAPGKGAKDWYEEDSKDPLKSKRDFDAKDAYERYVYAQKSLGAKVEPFAVWKKGWGNNARMKKNETPLPGSLTTGNVQKVVKCPTCEGQTDLKIGCPTCGGSGRVKPQDKFMQESKSKRK